MTLIILGWTRTFFFVSCVKVLILGEKSFVFLFCRVESDENTHAVWVQIFVIYWRLWGQNERCKIFRVRVKKFGRCCCSCWVSPMGTMFCERAALECDFKYYAVQYFVGDRAPDRALSALLLSSIAVSAAAASVDESYQKQIYTKKLLYVYYNSCLSSV